jgi:hypothetical protein
MIVVSDTSPIRALVFLEHLAVLEQLFGTVVIPPAVVDELAHPARLAPDESPVDLSSFPFIEIRVPADQGRVGELAKELDRGESEAIVLEPIRKPVSAQESQPTGPVLGWVLSRGASMSSDSDGRGCRQAQLHR